MKNELKASQNRKLIAQEQLEIAQTEIRGGSEVLSQLREEGEVIKKKNQTVHVEQNRKEISLQRFRDALRKAQEELKENVKQNQILGIGCTKLIQKSETARNRARILKVGVEEAKNEVERIHAALLKAQDRLSAAENGLRNADCELQHLCASEEKSMQDLQSSMAESNKKQILVCELEHSVHHGVQDMKSLSDQGCLLEDQIQHLDVSKTAKNNEIKSVKNREQKIHTRFTECIKECDCLQKEVQDYEARFVQQKESASLYLQKRRDLAKKECKIRRQRKELDCIQSDLRRDACTTLEQLTNERK